MKQYQAEMIDTLLNLLAIDSTEAVPAPGAPFGLGCRRALDYALNSAAAMGMRVRNIDGYIGYAEVGSGELFGILGHLDTVPFGSDWQHSPLGEVADGKIYGRGAEDDKGPMIAALYALKALLDEGLTPKKRIRLIFGCNEESGWKCIDRYLATEEIPAMSFSPDADFPVINCEKGVAHIELCLPLPQRIISFDGGTRVNMVPDRAVMVVSDISDVIVSTALRTNIRIRKVSEGYSLEATGISAHGSTPHKGDNAIIKLLRLTRSLAGEIGDIYDLLSATDGSGCSVALSDDKSGALTLNTGIVRAEGDKLKLSLDIRYPVTYTAEHIIAALRLRIPNGEISISAGHLPLYVEPECHLVQQLIGAYNEVTGEVAAPIAIGGATYARAFPNSVAFGPIFPGEESSIHQRDENVKIDRFIRTSEIYRLALKKLCFRV